MAGGVAGAVDAKLSAFMRVRSSSPGGGENEGSMKCGGCGNRDKEMVECGVRIALERSLSVENSRALGRGERRDAFVFTVANCGGRGTDPKATDGFGSLFRELKMRIFPDDVVVEILEMLPPCVRGSAD